MGERARQYFEEAERTGGIVAKMRLASLAQITSIEAERVEDTPALLGRLADASAKVAPSGAAAAKKEPISSVPAVGVEGMIAPPSSATPETRALRRQLATCVELATYRGLVLGDAEAIKRITEASAATIDVERVSIWFLEANGRKIRCADLFERGPRRHSSGIELWEKDYGAYFAALSKERTIAAHDAFTDPRTSCFRDSYLAPLDIRAMLDVPIWQAGRMIGVVCHEHLGAPRIWNADEETFGYLVANFVALAIDSRRPRT